MSPTAPAVRPSEHGSDHADDVTAYLAGSSEYDDMEVAGLDDLTASDSQESEGQIARLDEALSHASAAASGPPTTSYESQVRRRARRGGQPGSLVLKDSHRESAQKTLEGSREGAGDDKARSPPSRAALEFFLNSLPVNIAAHLRNISPSLPPPQAQYATLPIRLAREPSASAFTRGRARSSSPPRSGLSHLGTDAFYHPPAPPPAFAEQFKYQICSSTLLDPMPKMTRRATVGESDAGPWNDGDKGQVTEVERSDSMSAVAGQSLLPLASATSTSTDDSSSMVSTTQAWSVNHAPWERAEFAIASLLAIGGVWQMVGWLWLEVLAGFAIGICGVLGIVLGMLFGDQTKQNRKRRKASAIVGPALEPTAPLAPAPITPPIESPPRQSLQATALESLDAFVQANAELDDDITRAIGAFGVEDARTAIVVDTDAREKVDRTLRQLGEEMCVAAGSLLPFTNQAELAGLTAMYGVTSSPAIGSIDSSPPASGTATGAVGLDTADTAQPAHSTPTRFQSSPWRNGPNFHSPISTASRRLRLSHSNSHLPQVSIDSPTEDRLTPLPRRSPFPVHRRSLQDGPWSPASPVSKTHSPMLRRSPFGDADDTPSRPSRPPRWPSRVMEEQESEADNPGLGLQEVPHTPLSPATPIARTASPLPSDSQHSAHDAPASPPRPSHRLRELRLSQSGTMAFGGTAAKGRPPPDQTMPLPAPHEPEDKRVKRRSLQDIGYKRPLSLVIPSVDVPGLQAPINLATTASDPSVNLSRARSLPGRRYGHGPSASVPNARAFPSPQAVRRSEAAGHARSNSYRSQRGAAELAPPSALDSSDRLSTTSLKTSFIELHKKRREAVCCLLALNFVFDAETDDPLHMQQDLDLVRQDELEVARYWAEIHLQLDRMRRQVKEARDAMASAVPPINARAPQRKTQGRERHGAAFADFAPPRQTDQVLLDDHIAALLDNLEHAKAILGSVRADNHAGISENGTARQWGAIRTTMGNMIADWERGRIVISRMLDEDSAADTSAQSQDIVTPAQTPGEQDLPVFLDAWAEEESMPVEPRRTKLEAQVETPMEDDATRYLLDSTSPAFLPPPGLEAVFEAANARPAPATKAGPKLTREERIKAARTAREAAANRRASDAENQPERVVAAASGDMVVELKNVIGELRKRRETVRDGIARRGTVLREM